MATIPWIKNRWLRVLAWVVLGVLALWLVTWLAVPPILKSQVQKIASDKLGRAVTVGDVDFKPWTLELTARDVTVAGPKGASSPTLQLAKLYVNAELQSVFRLAPVVDAITVDGVQVKVARTSPGHYDFDDILDRLAANAQPAEPSSGPARFALYNLSLTNGSVDIDDQPLKREHKLSGLTLTVPFLSSFDGQRDVTVEPRLAFDLNGSRFDSAASSTPFAQTRKTDATINLTGLDVRPYLGYIPDSVPVKVQSGVLDATLRVAFEQTPQTSVALSGSLKASNIKVDDKQGRGLMSLAAVKVDLLDLRPLEKKVKLGEVAIDSPSVSVRRDAKGLVNLALLSSGSPAAPAESASAAKAPASGPASSPSASSPTAWAIEVASVAVNGGQVSWHDEATGGPSPASIGLTGLQVTSTGIAIPFKSPLKFKASAAVSVLSSAVAASAAASGPANAKALATGGRLTAEGEATDREATAKAEVDGLPLSLAAPYVAAYLEPAVAGTLKASATIDWSAESGLKVKNGDAALDGLLLDTSALPEAVPARPVNRRASADRARSDRALSANVAGANGAASVEQIKISGANLDLNASKLDVASIAVVAPRATVSRDVDKRWMFERWLKQAEPAGKPVADEGATRPTTPGGSASAAATPASAAASGGKPWAVELGDVALTGGYVRFTDRATPRPVDVTLSDLQVRASKLGLGARPASPVSVSARVASGRTDPGRLGFNGTVGLQPLQAQGEVDIARLPLAPAQAYLGDVLNVVILRADTSFKGKVAFSSATSGPTVQANGDVLIDNFQANTVDTGPTAAAKPATAASAPAGSATASAEGSDGANAMDAGNRKTADQREARSSGSVASTLRRRSASSADDGDELLSWKSLGLRGLNLAMVPGKPLALDIKETLLTDAYARLILNEDARLNLADVVKSSPPQAKPTAPESASAAKSRTAASAPIIHVGPITLSNAKVSFSDHFIKPNYSADLSELSGSLGAFSSGVESSGAEPQLADLALKGRAESTASLEITGKLNPLAKPLALDIGAKVRDLELAPLTPYSVKYSGYGIERGKMSVDVHYLIKPDGQLTAENKLVLNQLSFGDKVPGAAASLPVKLAVALLADKNGVIDVDLPVSGSLNDPQFNIGALIGKAVLNLLVKAITSPFSLLANAFGGNGGPSQSNVVTFEPGSVMLDGKDKAMLDKVAQALIDRPSLKMTVVGTASVEAEREAYRRERLNELLQAEKRKAGGKAAAASSAAAASAASSAGNGGSPAVDPAPVEISPAEYPELLRAVYKNADIEKPRNMLGLARDIEPARMESLLLSNISVTDESIRQLAVQRGVAVRDYLASRRVPLDRLFLGAAQSSTGIPASQPAARPADGTMSGPVADAVAAARADGAASAPDAKRSWTPSAELTLSPK